MGQESSKFHDGSNQQIRNTLGCDSVALERLRCGSRSACPAHRAVWSERVFSLSQVALLRGPFVLLSALSHSHRRDGLCNRQCP